MEFNIPIETITLDNGSEFGDFLNIEGYGIILRGLLIYNKLFIHHLLRCQTLKHIQYTHYRFAKTLRLILIPETRFGCAYCV